jgi:hypothetical protein
MALASCTLIEHFNYSAAPLRGQDADVLPANIADASDSSTAGCSRGQMACGVGCLSAADIHHCQSCTADCTQLENVMGSGSCTDSGCAFPASACEPGHADCNGIGNDGCETDITTSTNCGQCGHNCLGGPCVNGSCQPQTLIGGIDTPTGMDVDANGLYFIVDGDVQGCALSGCASGIQQIGMFSIAENLAAVAGSVAFYTGPMYQNPFLCPTSGCTSGQSISSCGRCSSGAVAVSGNNVDFLSPVEGGLSVLFRCDGVTGSSCTTTFSHSYQGPGAEPPIADDGSFLYYLASEWFDGGTDVVKCPVDTTCDPPNIVTSFAARLMVVYGGQLYMTGAPTNSGDLFSCPVSGCASPTSLQTGVYATFAFKPTQGLVADASGIYYTAGSGVYTCPLTGCTTTGARQVASRQASPGVIRTDSQFVYWVNRGEPNDAGAGFVPGSASIVRLLK